jgi:hypothetical protein
MAMKCPKCGAENARGMLQCGNCDYSLDPSSSPTSGQAERHDSIEHLLSRAALRAESALKEQLDRRRGFLVKSLILPMIVVFRSEIETASLHVDKQGGVSVRRGELPEPTMVIEGSHSSICRIIESDVPRLHAPGPLRLTLNWGPFRGKTIEMVDGQVMDHPLKDLFGY